MKHLELWFQQDGATCHTARATIDLLKDTFGDRLISRFGPVNWPPRSCDLTPLDYFLWGYVKSLVYGDKPQTLDHLEDNIRRVIADIRDRTCADILKILKRLSFSRQIHFQWIPSHVDIAGNEIVDSLAETGVGETTTPATPLTFLELFSKYKAKNKAIWMVLPVHPWYQSECPGGSLVRGSSRRDQTEPTRFLSGHLLSLTFVDVAQIIWWL
ncbi:RNase H domain-containing protein [Trichonephila clavipes]|nr:RNase H domain-containing protein [Trichonephila clavipes]